MNGCAARGSDEWRAPRGDRGKSTTSLGPLLSRATSRSGRSARAACWRDRTGSTTGGCEHDPEKWIPVFPRDKREAFARRSCSNKKIVGNIRMSVSVEMREVAKSFGQTRALKGVSMDIAAGSVHGLIGPNGSGKSTLIRLLTGLERPDSGTITLAGSTHREIHPGQARRVGIELVPQELALVPLG